MIRLLNPSLESDLRWQAERMFVSAYGLRCGSPWMNSGAGLCLRMDRRGWQCGNDKGHPGLCSPVDPSTVEDSERHREPDGSTPASRAYVREQRIREGRDRCTREQRHALDLAFASFEEPDPKLLRFGTYWGAVFACPEARAAFRERRLPGQAPRDFLIALADATEVKRLCEASERFLLGALTSYGAEAEYLDETARAAAAHEDAPAEEPKSVGLNRLAKALGMDKRTLKERLEQLKIRRTQPKGKIRYHLSDLRRKWPEGAQRLLAA